MKQALSLLLMLLCLWADAQNYPVTGITISLPANPDASIVNWKTGASMLTITASAKMFNGRVDESAETSKILVVIKKGGSKVCGTYTASSAPTANFTTASKIWTGNNAVSLLGQECTLTPGDYELCVQFFNPQGSMPLSAEKCKSFSIVASEQVYTGPQNIIPTDGSIFNTSMASQPVLFKWTPVIPTPNEPVTYRLKVWKIQQGQTPTQAMNLNQPVATKDVTAATQTNIINLMDASCLLPSSCDFVWQVQALGSGGKFFGPNSGKSNTTVFGTEKNTSPPVVTSCNTTSTKTWAIGDEILLSDDFKMKLTAIPTGTNDLLSGTGTVRVKWLGIFNVKFKDIKINAQNKLCAGAVYTKSDPNINYPTNYLKQVLNTPIEWTKDKVKDVADWIQSQTSSKPLVPAADEVGTESAPAVDMPLGYFKDGDPLTSIGFTEMIFRPDYAEFEVIASMNTNKMFKSTSPLSGTNAIALRGDGIKFKNTGLKGIVGSIKLAETLVVSYSNNGTENLKLTFHKEGAGHAGNGLVFSADNNDFWKFDFDVSADLPREWLVPANPNATNVTVNFQAQISRWNDFVLQGTLPDCIIPNSNGLGIQSSVIAYDHSFNSNPAGIVFPAGYAGNTNSFFSGFYVKNFKLTLPDQLRSYADTTKQVEIGAENLIIDEYGVSGKILANNVISYPKANIGNLGASIDTVSVNIANSTLTQAKMAGSITLPMCGADNVADAIKYSALFIPDVNNNNTQQTQKMVFTLKPGNDITSKFLGNGKLQINQTSSLNLTLAKVNGERNIIFHFDINGKVYYPTGKILDPGSSIPLDLDLSCNFEHMGMYYRKAAVDSFALNVGNWAFASPQKKLSGFAFTITAVDPKIEPIGAGTEKQYLFKGGIDVVAKINIGSENSNVNISGDTRIALIGAIESSLYTAPTTPNTSSVANLNVLTAQVQTPSNLDYKNPGATINAIKEDYGFLTQLKPKYLGVQVKSIGIDVTTAAVKIKGNVDFYKKDPKYGNGFKGVIQAKFTTIDLAIQAGAIFGNTKYIPNNNGNGFKYWMVEAQVNIPPPGIVFMTGVAFRGFGAGVYSRMNMTPPATFNPTAAAASTFGGAVFTPDETVKMGFKVKAIIATTPKEETFNGSVALGAEFNANGGMNFIQFDGLFNCGAKIGQENKAFANGAINVKYDFPNKIFSMNSLLNINADPITTPTPISTRLYVNSKQNKWYFKSGTPDTPMTVKIDDLLVQSYLMFGNDLGNDIPKGFMKQTRDGFAALGYGLPGFNETATGDNKYQSAKGFAFGLGITAKKADTYEIWHKNNNNKFDLSYLITAGGEIDASLLQYANCQGFGDGWRAKMSIAVYAGATLSYSGALLGYGKSGTLASAKGAVSATAEFPHPTYLQGQVDGDINILDVVKTGFHKSFVMGEQCGGTELTPDPTVSVYNQQNVADSLNYSLIKNIVTPGTSNVDRVPTFAVLLNYPFNEAFDVDEQQSSGEIKSRTFRATYTATLKQDSAGGVGTVSQAKNLSAQAKLSMGANSTTTPPGQAGQSNTAGGNQGTATDVVAIIPGAVDMVGAKKFLLKKTGVQVTPLKANTSYHFQVTAKLEEKVGNAWVPVKKKGTSISITQTQHLWFKTNSDPVGNNTSSGQNTAPTGIKKVI
jgi:hypothetical protein